MLQKLQHAAVVIQGWKVEYTAREDSVEADDRKQDYADRKRQPTRIGYGDSGEGLGCIGSTALIYGVLLSGEGQICGYKLV